MSKPADAIAKFFREDDLMEAFVAEMQAGRDPWGSCIDHAGRLVLTDPDREVYTVQPGENGGFDAVHFNQLYAAFDPEAVIQDGTKDDFAEAQRIANVETPRAAFEAVCRHCELDLDMEIPSP